MTFFHVHRVVIMLVHQLQIFKPIILTIMIQMMYDFILFKIATYRLLHDYSVKHHIAIFVRVWMQWSISENIAAIMKFRVTISVETIVIT